MPINLGMIWRGFTKKYRIVKCGKHFKARLRTTTPHVQDVTKSRMLSCLSLASTEVLRHAFIYRRIDFCHALLPGLPRKSLSSHKSLRSSGTRFLFSILKLKPKREANFQSAIIVLVCGTVSQRALQTVINLSFNLKFRNTYIWYSSSYRKWNLS